MSTVRLTLNGAPAELDDTDELLLDALRDQAGLTSVRYCCGIGVCGTCTVLLDGVAATACLTLTAMAAGRRVDTAESVLGCGDRTGVCGAFADAGAFQCSYCIPAMALTTASVLAAEPDATAERVRGQLGGNICRCGSYPQISAAIDSLTGTQSS